MIDRLALARNRPGPLRDTVIVLWNLSGMVLMWQIMYNTERENWPVAAIASFMFCTALFIIMHTGGWRRKD